MSEPPLSVGRILAHNLRMLMERRADADTAAAISRLSAKRVSDNTVLNMLNPDRGIAATIENVQAVAEVFGRHAWELLHPDLQAADQERAVIASWRALEASTQAAEHGTHRLTPTANAPRPPTIHEPLPSYGPRKTPARKP